MVKGSIVGSNNGANVCSDKNNDGISNMSKVEIDIIKELKENQGKPLSTSDFSAKLGKAWHTIDRACLMLQIQGKIERFKVGKMNLWRLNGKI